MLKIRESECGIHEKSIFATFSDNSHIRMCEVIFHCGNLFLKHKSIRKSMEERQHFSTNGVGTNGQPTIWGEK